MSRVLLSGFMGCGKSVTGVRLATRICVEFIDLDDRISALAGMSIEKIFDEHGESAFRKLESQALKSLPDHIVCSLGGGTLMDPQNLAWALETSWLVYLRVSVQELHRRLQADPAIRPLLIGYEEPKQMEMRIRELLGQREPIYRQAHQILDVDGVSPDGAAEKCWNAYSRRKE